MLLVLNKLVVVGNFLIFVGIIFNLFVVVMELEFVIVICWLDEVLFEEIIVDLFSLVVMLGNVGFMMKFFFEIVVRLNDKLFFLIEFDIIVFLFFDVVWLFVKFFLFLGIFLGSWKFCMMYLLLCFCLSVIFKFGVFVELGFFLGCFVIVEGEFVMVVVVVVILFVEKENVGDMDENGNVLNVGDGVLRVKVVNEGDVFRKMGVFGFDGVFMVVLNRVVLEGSERFVSLVVGCFVFRGSGSFLLVLIGSFFNLIFCVFFMMYCIVVGIDRYLLINKNIIISLK